MYLDKYVSDIYVRTHNLKTQNMNEKARIEHKSWVQGNII